MLGHILLRLSGLLSFGRMVQLGFVAPRVLICITENIGAAHLCGTWRCNKNIATMFVLADIEDTIRVEPRFFVKPAAVAIEDQINTKYANRVRGS